MKLVDVLNRLESLQKDSEDMSHSHCSYDFESDVLALQIAIQAVKKQIPAQLIISETLVAYGCPSCGKTYWSRYSAGRICQGCGQRLVD